MGRVRVVWLHYTLLISVSISIIIIHILPYTYTIPSVLFLVICHIHDSSSRHHSSIACLFIYSARRCHRHQPYIAVLYDINQPFTFCAFVLSPCLYPSHPIPSHTPIMICSIHPSCTIMHALYVYLFDSWLNESLFISIRSPSSSLHPFAVALLPFVIVSSHRLLYSHMRYSIVIISWACWTRFDFLACSW